MGRATSRATSRPLQAFVVVSRIGAEAAGRVSGEDEATVPRRPGAQSVLDAAGVEAHARMQGRSFWPGVTGQPGEPPAEGFYYRYWEHDNANHQATAHYGYRTEPYKILYFYNDGLGIPARRPVSTPE